MATYAEFDYDGYPSGSQVCLSNSNTIKHSDEFQSAQTRVSLVSASPQSSVGDNRTDSVIAVDAPSAPSAALSPDDLTTSQTSNSAGGPKSVTNISLNTESLAMGHVPGPGTSCCENGEPITADLVSGERVCPCQYDPARFALSSYARLPAPSMSVYGTPYPPTDHNPYQSIGMDSAVFYSPLSNPYALKDSSGGSEMAWTSVGLQATTGYYPYDHMSSYGYGSNYDLTARRKNTTRESTATLKAWLNEHKKNPYPTKGEKIMLAIITKMTLTQISTWFANARRRLKKENKMTWEPKNRNDDDDDVRESDDGKDKEDIGTLKAGAMMHPTTADTMSTVPDHGRDSLNERFKTDQGKHEFNLSDGNHRLGPLASDRRLTQVAVDYEESHAVSVGGIHSYYYRPHYHGTHYQHQQKRVAGHSDDLNAPKIQMSHSCDVSLPAHKSKIWSLADTIACKTPPPVTFMGQRQFHQMSPARVEASSHMGTAPGRKQQHPLQQPNTPNSFVSEPFDQAPSATFGHFLGASSQQLHIANNSPYQDSTFNYSSDIKDKTTSNTSSQHSMAQLQAEQLARKQQQQQQYQHHQQQSLLQNAYMSGQQMGFPGAQPDTPPQTPPNMKIHNASAKLVLIASQTHTSHSCRTSNKACGSAANMATRFGECSSRDDSSSESSNSSNSSEGDANVITAVYEPFFNSENLSSFVPQL